MHIASSCEGLEKKKQQQEYKVRHDAVRRRVKWELCRKYGIACCKKLYQHIPKKVSTSANGNVKILWDAEINGTVRHNRPDTAPCCYERKQKD